MNASNHKRLFSGCSELSNVSHNLSVNWVCSVIVDMIESSTIAIKWMDLVVIFCQLPFCQDELFFLEFFNSMNKKLSTSAFPWELGSLHLMRKWTFWWDSFVNCCYWELTSNLKSKHVFMLYWLKHTQKN